MEIIIRFSLNNDAFLSGDIKGEDSRSIMKSIVNRWRYRKFSRMDQPMAIDEHLVCENTIVSGNHEFKKLELQDDVTVVNYGDISGNIVIQKSKFINYGKFTGRIISEKGVLYLKKQAETNGRLFAKEIILSIGTELNGTTTLGVRFTEEEKRAIVENNFDEFDRLIEQRKD